MTVNNGDVLQCAARFQDVQGNDLVNVWHFRADFATTESDGDVFDAVDQFIRRVFQEFLSIQDDDTTTQDLKVDVVDFINGKWVVTKNVGFGPWWTAYTPTGVDDALPQGVAALGTLFTNLGKHAGRKFIGGLTDDLLSTEGLVRGSHIATILLGLSKLLIPEVVSSGNELVTVVLDRAAGIVRDVLDVGVSATPAYQRRRRPGTGS